MQPNIVTIVQTTIIYERDYNIIKTRTAMPDKGSLARPVENKRVVNTCFYLFAIPNNARAVSCRCFFKTPVKYQWRPAAVVYGYCIRKKGLRTRVSNIFSAKHYYSPPCTSPLNRVRRSGYRYLTRTTRAWIYTERLIYLLLRIGILYYYNYKC